MTPVDVYIAEQHVGQLRDGRDARFEFRFTDAYRALAVRPVLGQKFEDDLGRVYAGKRAGGLPAFFANALPEGNLRSIIEHSLGLEDATDLDLLVAVEADLPGALRLRVGDDDDDAPALARARADDDEPKLEIDEQRFRFSLAGAQLKFSALRADERFTLPARDQTGEWIIKLGSDRFVGLAENEYTVLSWARTAGFDVPAVRLVGPEQIGDLARHGPADALGLAIRRYDRDGQRRIHQEDFNQVMGIHPKPDGTEKYGLSYDQLLLVIAATTGEEGFREALRRLAFVVASGNSDAHLKNWSLVYHDGVHARLSPLYDQVCVVAWPQLDRELALKLMGSRQYGEVSLETFGRLATKLNVGVTDDDAKATVSDAVRRLCEAWQILDTSAMAPSHVKALQDHWQRVPLLRDFGRL